MIIISYTLKGGSKYFGHVNGNEFFIGEKVSYNAGKGLMNNQGTKDQKYDPAKYRGKYGFWADFIYPIAMSEGLCFHTLNTYDKAYFTFSFLQFAAHVPDNDFVVYLRELLALQSAKDYFPDLCITNGRIGKITDHGVIALENSNSTELLMDYFNPSVKEVEDVEIIQSAKMIHWVQNDPEHRDVQVKVGIRHFKDKMYNYSRQYGLDGVEDSLCLVVTDIRHQGRAKSPEIVSALRSPHPLDALLTIGDSRFHNRLIVLRNEIERMTQQGILGKKRYNEAAKDFI